MKTLLYLSVAIFTLFLADVSLASTNCYWRLKSPSRKINFDGNIKAVLKRDSGEKINGRGFYPGAYLIIGKTNEYPQANIQLLYFFDAKLDEKSNRLAVIYDGGEPLVYDYYELQNDKWVLLKRTFLMTYGLFFQKYCTKIEIVDMNNIKIVFNLMKEIGVAFMKENDIKMKDVEGTFIITIKDDGKIFINDKEKTLALDHIRNYITEEDKARISKLKKQKEKWLKENPSKRKLEKIFI